MEMGTINSKIVCENRKEINVTEQQENMLHVDTYIYIYTVLIGILITIYMQ